MPQVVRPRIGALTGPPPTAPLPHRFRSLADREAVEVLHRAARVLVASLPALTDRLVEALYAQEPGYRAAIESDRAEVWQEVHHSLRHNVGSLIQPREFRESAHRTSRWIGEIRAEQGVPLDAVLHAFRMGGAMVWQDLVDETARRDPDDVRLLVHVAADVWNFVDEHCGIVADAYRQAERRLTWRRENRQRLMVAALLDGTARIADLADAAAMLGLPEQGRYAVLAVATDPRGPGSAARPALTLPTAPEAAVLWHPGQDAEFAILPLAGPPGELSELAAALDVPPGARAGIGSAVEGWPRSATPAGWRRPRCAPAPRPAAPSCSTSTSRTPWSSPPRPSPERSPTGCWARWTGWTPPTATSSWRPSPPGWTRTAPRSGRARGSTATATPSSTASAASNSSRVAV